MTGVSPDGSLAECDPNQPPHPEGRSTQQTDPQRLASTSLGKALFSNSCCPLLIDWSAITEVIYFRGVEVGTGDYFLALRAISYNESTLQ